MNCQHDFELSLESHFGVQVALRSGRGAYRVDHVLGTGATRNLAATPRTNKPALGVMENAEMIERIEILGGDLGR